MDVDEFLTRAEEAKRKHAADLAMQELQVQAANRRTDLRNAFQSFGALHSSAFQDSLPPEQTQHEWSGTEWAQHRARFDDWRTAKTMAICSDARVLAWKQEILALAPTDIPQRNTAMLILKAAVEGREATVRAIWGSMLPEAADDKERYPNSDPALLPTLVSMWLRWKMADELTESNVLPSTISAAAVIQSESATVEDGPRTDRIAFVFEGQEYTAGLEPIAWRFLRQTYWRMGEFINGRDLLGAVWEREVNADAWNRNPHTVLSETQAKDLIAKVNAFTRMHSLPYHAEQNAKTGARVFALFNTPPKPTRLANPRSARPTQRPPKAT